VPFDRAVAPALGDGAFDGAKVVPQFRTKRCMASIPVAAAFAIHWCKVGIVPTRRMVPKLETSHRIVHRTTTSVLVTLIGSRARIVENPINRQQL
jgi:hypothetical protein